MVLFSIIMIVFIIYKSLKWIWTDHKTHLRKLRFLPFEYFVVLLLTYIIILVGFGCMYAVIIVTGKPILVEAGQLVAGQFLQLLSTGMYFSAITMFSVGYGDITPIGIGRWIAIIEALIGYMLPIAFVMRSFLEMEEAYSIKKATIHTRTQSANRSRRYY
ncbi:potassium channel family protein [Calidifontibacillus oryziterrae]|uniref:potassium channel family protein n=1 Tax=Calidifontibacillus oryziterrae TaxID=1191699 RepID=UPI0003152160|nr:potassium channel family protein [Calidifontibacillus oryziterrae]